jgi:hypothetical protein
MPGARCARSLVCSVLVAHECSHHGHAGSPGIPRAMVLTVSFALSPVIGLSCHRHRRKNFRQLDAGVEASGPHDFAVRKRALSSVALPASTASRPALVTCATPLFRDRTAVVVEVIWVNREEEYFSKLGWTGKWRNSLSGKSVEASSPSYPALPSYPANGSRLRRAR